MESKLTYYDIVAHVVPGTLLLAVLALLPWALDIKVQWPDSQLIRLALALPLAYALGQVVQALSSFMEPIYFWLWGGKPSDVLLAGSSHLLRDPRLDKIASGLSTLFDSSADSPSGRQALFSDAMALCNEAGLGRVETFNASYAFHRGLLTSSIISTGLLALGTVRAAADIRPNVTYLLVVLVAITVIEFFRARQRGMYFALEVLNMAYIRSRESQGASGH